MQLKSKKYSSQEPLGVQQNRGDNLIPRPSFDFCHKKTILGLHFVVIVSCHEDTPAGLALAALVLAWVASFVSIYKYFDEPCLGLA